MLKQNPDSALLSQGFVYLLYLSAMNWRFLPVLAILFTSCAEDYVPKPKGYNRIDLPPQKYQPLQEKHPYWFEYSASAKVLRDSSRLAEPHWIDLYYPMFKANIQLTYKPLENNRKRFESLIEDARRLTSKHQIKASGIEE